MRRLPLISVTVVFLAACSWLPTGGGTGGDPGGKPPDAGGGPIIVEPDPRPGNGVGGDGALREEPDPTIVDARPAAIDHFLIGPDGRTVTVYWWGGNQACFGLREVTLGVVDDVPALTVWEGTRPAAVGMACTMEALLKSAVVPLPAPILSDGSGKPQAAGEGPLMADPLIVVPGAALNPVIVPVIGYLLSADGLTLTVLYVGGLDQCYAVAPPAVERVAGALQVTIREGGRPGGPQACDAIGVAKGVVIAGTAPLLIDGASH